MKNYFTSVLVPRSDPSLIRLSNALAELVDQLRYTVNNIDLDNMTAETVNTIRSGTIHLKSGDDISSGRISDVRKGDLVVVASQEDGRLARLGDIYLCIRDIPAVK